MGSPLGRRKKERGAALVEFAVVAPLLFLLLFGVIEFARVVSAYTTVWTGAREGARYATTSAESDINGGVPRFRDCDGIYDAIQAKAVTSSIDSSDTTIQWINESGTIIADCDGADATYPDPAQKTGPLWSVILDNGTIIRVEVRGTFDAIVPMVGSFVDGLTLDSTQTRSIYEGIVGAE